MNLIKRVAVCGLLILSSTQIRAGTFTVEQLAASYDIRIPGQRQAFYVFLSVKADGDNLCMVGYSNKYEAAGIYKVVDGTFRTVMDMTTRIPGSSSRFTAFGAPAIDGSRVAFWGGDGNVSGLFKETADGLIKVIDSNTRLPGSEWSTDFIGDLSFDDDQVVFRAAQESFGGISSFFGIYMVRGGSVTKIADQNTPIPGGIGTFTDFSEHAFKHGVVAFAGEGPAGQRGIYVWDGKTLRAAIDNNAFIPGRTVPFTYFSSISVDGNNVAFAGSGHDGYNGIYKILDGTLVPVADFLRTPPGLTPFVNYGQVSLRGLDVTFSVYPWYEPEQVYSEVKGVMQRMVMVPDSDSTDVAGMDGDAVILDVDLQCCQHNTVILREAPVQGALSAVARDYDGDGMTDRAVYESEFGEWHIRGSAGPMSDSQFGFGEVTPAPADFDGDGKTDLSVFDPAAGTWYQLLSLEGFRSVQFGYPGVKTVPADYDGDGKADIAVFDASGVWYVMGTASGFWTRQFGFSGAVPVPADYDGDGFADLAVYDPTPGIWYILATSDGFSTTQFGFIGAVPVPADYDGDQKCDLAVFGPGAAIWYVSGSSAGFSARQFGFAGVSPVPGDYDGDISADLAAYDPATGAWYILGSGGAFFRQ